MREVQALEDEAADDGVVPVQLGNWTQPALVEEALNEDAVHHLADATVLAIDEVTHLSSIREGDADQVS